MKILEGSLCKLHRCKLTQTFERFPICDYKITENGRCVLRIIGIHWRRKYTTSTGWWRVRRLETNVHQLLVAMDTRSIVVSVRQLLVAMDTRSIVMSCPSAPGCHGYTVYSSVCPSAPGCHGYTVYSSVCPSAPGCHGYTVYSSVCPSAPGCHGYTVYTRVVSISNNRHFPAVTLTITTD